MCNSDPSTNIALQSKDIYKFSFFKAPIRNVIPTKTESLEGIYQLITSNEYESITNDLRTAQDKSKRSEIKGNELDYVTFSGVFTTRSNKALIKHSNLLCIDIDDVDDIASLKSKIIELLTPSLLFVSPSGNGLKIIYKIYTTTNETHLDYFKAFQNFFDQELNIAIDTTCKEVSRACFLCHDKDAYFNKDADVLDRSFIDTFEKVEATILDNDNITSKIESNRGSFEYLEDPYEIIKRLKTWIDRDVQFVSGFRNKYISKLAYACNRAGVPLNLAEYNLCEYEKSDFPISEIKAIIKSAYKDISIHGSNPLKKKQHPYEDKSGAIKEQKTPLLPIEGFPEEIQSFINEYTDTYNTPRDYIASSILFAFALAVGTSLDLKTKHSNIPILWMCIVGQASSGKTNPLMQSLKYFQKEDEAAFKEYRKMAKAYEEYENLTQKERKKLPYQNKPEYFQYILSDFTPEALYQAHTVNNRGICIYRDELKGWFDDFDRYNKSGDQSRMLSTFTREAIQINRKTTDPINLANPAIFVCGGIQPELLKDLAKDNRAENGFLARMIFVYPDHQDKPEYSDRELSKDSLEEIFSYLNKLTSRKNAQQITLSEEAKEVYIKWYNTNASEINSEKIGYLRGVYGKLDINCLRLAIAVHGMKVACNGVNSALIDLETMKSAVALTKYFTMTALKVYDDIFGKKSEDIDKTAFINKLRSKGMSQAEIGKYVDLTQQTVSKILKKNKK